MAHSNNNAVQSFLAATDLSAAEYKIVKIAGADNTVALCSANTDIAMGILTDEVANGASTVAAVAVRVAGRGKVKVGANGVTRGLRITSDASGLAENAGSGDHYVGIALQTGVSGDIIECLVMPGAQIN